MTAMEEHMLRKAKSIIDLHGSGGASGGVAGALLRESRRSVNSVNAGLVCPERSASAFDLRAGTGSAYPNTHASRDIYHTETYRPRPHRRDWDTLDEYNHDRAYFSAPLTLPTHRFAGRRYNLCDPPVSLSWYYPGSYYTPSRRFGVLDPSDPVYALRYRNTDYDPSPANPCSPWAYNPGDVSRGIGLYKKGLCSFDALERNWLSPSAWQRRTAQFTDVYVPAVKYGVRRYAYPIA